MRWLGALSGFWRRWSGEWLTVSVCKRYGSGELVMLIWNVVCMQWWFQVKYFGGFVMGYDYTIVLDIYEFDNILLYYRTLPQRFTVCAFWIFDKYFMSM